MNTEVDRKIAVILVADVVGYSKHMERDENATLKAYAECEKILKTCLKKYKGSIFNTAGDSALAEFPSAVNAVECGVAFQNDIKKRNESDKTEVKLAFRIGINMGDVVKKEGNLSGDGVNIAARLEALAQPNGISISKSVYDLVVPKTKMTFNDLGVQKVKQNEFHAFDILLDPSQKRSLKTKSGSMLPIIGAVTVALTIGLTTLFFVFSGSEKQTVQISSKPVILVEPISASGLSESQKGFEKGATESMISTLSSYKSIKVLSSSTSFHVSEKRMQDRDIHDNYGVEFIVSGSLQVISENARLNLELRDLDTNEVIVTKNRTFELNNIFKEQDKISNEILQVIQVDLTAGNDASKYLSFYKTIEDYTLGLNFRAEWRRGNLEGHRKAQAILDDLQSRYPEDNASLSTMEAWTIFQRVMYKISSDLEKDKKKLQLALDKSIEIDPKFPDSYLARAYIYPQLFNGTCEASMSDLEKAEESGSSSESLLIGAGLYNMCGQTSKSILRMKELLTLVPNDPGLFYTKMLSIFLFIEGNYDEIVERVGENIDAVDIDPSILLMYSVINYKKNNKKAALEYFDRARKVGYGVEKFKYFFRLNQETIDDSLKILTQIEKDL